MKKFVLSGTAVFLALTLFAAPSGAQDADLISLSAGMYDAGDDNEAGDFRLEYRWGTPFFWMIKPWAGAEVTTDTSIWAGAGVLADIELADRLVLTPSFGVGFYDEGDSDLDLDYPVEFRSQLEISYKFDNENRVGISYGHISNASLGDDNPGVEILGLYWHVPVQQIFHN
jgi:lipid A 3-O-deacylase